MIDINTDQQLYQEGISSTGRSLLSYTPFTEQIKKDKGQPSDRTTLRDTGDFHDSFKLDSNKFPFGITANDPKTSMLTAKYGEDIFGLTKENEEDHIENYIEPDILDQAEKQVEEAFKVFQ